MTLTSAPLTQVTDRDLGDLHRHARSTGDTRTLARVTDEIHRRGYILSADEIQVGSRVIETGENLPGTVAEITATAVVVDFGYERTPGVPGSRRTAFLDLADGALKHAPQI